MKIEIFDTTLRDGEQGAGVEFSADDKIRVIHALDELGVSYIEAGMMTDDPAKHAFFHSLSGLELKNAKLAVFGQTCRAGEKAADNPALRAIAECGVPAAVLYGKAWNYQVTDVLKTTGGENLRMIYDSISFVKASGKEVIFDAEHFFDGYADNPVYAMCVVDTAFLAGASRVVLCDTNGGMLPDVIGMVCAAVTKKHKNIGIHCHNDLGMATANTLAAVQNGARQVEVTINGLGERAGNTALEEVVMAIKCHSNLDFEVGIDSKQIITTSKLVSNLMRMPVQANKAIVGRNAFAHSSGIHQDGVLKSRETYEIIDPEDVGVDQSSIVLTARSGRAALKHHLAEIGYSPEGEELDEIYQRFLELADKKKMITTRDLEVLIGTAASRRRMSIQLTGLQIVCGKSTVPTATVQISFDGDTFTETACGNGPVDAAITAVKNITKRRVHIEEFLIQAITRGSDDLGKVHMSISHKGKMYHGFGANTDIVTASVESFIDAISKIA